MKVYFKDQWTDFFANHGLEHFNDFFDFNKGRTINKNQKRDVIAFSLGNDTQRKEFFMKRFHRPHYKDVFFTLFNFGHLCSQAECEWKNANLLLDNGIGTYNPVSYGQDNTFGLEKRSFFITEKLPGQCMTDYVNQNWDKLTNKQKQNLMVSLAKLTHQIHKANISLPDLYLWHIFVSQEQGEQKFAVIDLHRMKIRTKGDHEKIRNLGAFIFSLSPDYFDDSLIDVFLNSYMHDLIGNKTVFRKKVLKRTELLTSRRRRQKY